MYTSVALAFALGIFTMPESSPPWLNDYAHARKIAQRDGRPLAVFVSSGWRGFSKVSREGELSPKARDLLTRHYVCVYVDTSRPAARQLANALEITRSRGLVLSDRTGQFQAFHHDGDLTDTDLSTQLERFASAGLSVRSTESNGRVVSYYAPPASVAPTYTPVFRGVAGGC
jgi:hypothetical protein